MIDPVDIVPSAVCIRNSILIDKFALSKRRGVDLNEVTLMLETDLLDGNSFAENLIDNLRLEVSINDQLLVFSYRLSPRR